MSLARYLGRKLVWYLGVLIVALLLNFLLPRLIPGNPVVDISELGINDSLHLSDVIGKLPPQAEVLDNPEEALIAILPPRVEEPAEPVETAAEEPEVIGEEGAGEGDEAERDAE